MATISIYDDDPLTIIISIITLMTLDWMDECILDLKWGGDEKE